MLLITIISEIENLKSHIYRNVSGGHPPTGNISNAGSHLSSEDADVISFWTCNSCGAENANKKFIAIIVESTHKNEFNYV